MLSDMKVKVTRYVCVKTKDETMEDKKYNNDKEKILDLNDYDVDGVILILRKRPFARRFNEIDRQYEQSLENIRKSFIDEILNNKG